MGKLKKRKGRFAGARDNSTGLLLKDAFSKTNGFHKPQREHVKHPMPERAVIAPGVTLLQESE